MYRTNLRKVGGSVMLAVPPSLLELLDLAPGNEVAIAIERGRLIVEPRRRRYSLSELLAETRGRKRPTKQERHWVSDGRVGRELI